MFGLCPILTSLTVTISSDTIYALSAFMLLINLIFHDYGASNAAMYVNFFSLKILIIETKYP